MKSQLSLPEVQALIKKAGKTQTEAANALGVSHSYLSEVLGGTRQPGPKILEALGLRSETIYFFK